jgi:hypothetical protein
MLTLVHQTLMNGIRRTMLAAAGLQSERSRRYTHISHIHFHDEIRMPQDTMSSVTITNSPASREHLSHVRWTLQWRYQDCEPSPPIP